MTNTCELRQLMKEFRQFSDRFPCFFRHFSSYEFVQGYVTAPCNTCSLGICLDGSDLASGGFGSDKMNDSYIEKIVIFITIYQK